MVKNENVLMNPYSESLCPRAGQRAMWSFFSAVKNDARLKTFFSGDAFPKSDNTLRQPSMPTAGENYAILAGLLWRKCFVSTWQSIFLGIIDTSVFSALCKHFGSLPACAAWTTGDAWAWNSRFFWILTARKRFVLPRPSKGVYFYSSGNDNSWIM